MINQSVVSFTPRRETENLVEEVVRSAFESVASTMGPNGELALIIDVNQPVVTKDGVRVAKALDFNDIRKNSIAKLITSAAIKTDDVVGDGTTTTVLMTYALYNNYKSVLNFHASRIVDNLIKESKEHLDTLVSPVTPSDFRFERMVRTTANYQNDIADTVIKLYKDLESPNVSLKRGNGNVEDIIEINNKVSFEARYATPQLQWGTYRSHVKVENSNVIIINNDIREISGDFCEMVARYIIGNNGNPVYLMARSFDQQTHDVLVRTNHAISNNLKKQGLYIIPININSPGSLAADTVNDLAKLLNVNTFNDIESVKVEDIESGNVEDSFDIDLTGVYFDLNANKNHNERAQEILNKLNPLYESMNFTERANYMGKFLFSRISRLLAKNVTIIVSGMTKAEISERFYLYEDAVRVAGSSIRFGVLPGIGWGYNQVAEYLYEKYSYLKDTPSEQDRFQYEITDKFIQALIFQYSYITGTEYKIGGENKYFDLVTFEVSDEPTHVFDNGSSAIVALEGAWSVVKRLCKLSCILGKADTSYQM